MKPSKSVIVWLFSIYVLILFSSATSYANQDDFIQCLAHHSLSSNPILQEIYTPNNASFLSILHSYARNLRFKTPTTPKPLIIVTATHESHVQATILCARTLGLEIRIRSGGHDFEGISYVSPNPFVLLDLFNLRAIHVNLRDESAWVQTGATLGELFYNIAKESTTHAFPAGVCLTLGAGGHFSGGGYGNMMRKYGLSVDNIVDALIVDVKGRILNRNSMGEDLFWAIRGGGAYSFGVILAWKIKLVRVPPIVTVFRVEKTLEQGATDLVLQWQHIADKLDKDLFIRLNLETVNGSKKGEKTVKVSFIALFQGQSKRLLKLMNQSFPKLGLQQKDCIEMNWVQSTLSWAGYPYNSSLSVLLNRTLPGESFAKIKSDYVEVPISKNGLEAMWKEMIKAETFSMQWNPYGGKMSEISEAETPFPHRAGNIFKIQYLVVWDNDEATNDSIKLARKFYEITAPYVSKNPREAFLNYRDLDIGTNINGTYNDSRVYGLKYFKGNFDRLVRVKTRFDPNNFFRNEQSIPTRSSY